jgi:hypothetical protein
VVEEELNGGGGGGSSSSGRRKERWDWVRWRMGKALAFYRGWRGTKAAGEGDEVAAVMASLHDRHYQKGRGRGTE